jgi:2,4-dienoyl-CoA reductase-like NADH-dependent reductase (Old Yellow Enzyme family)
LQLTSSTEIADGGAGLICFGNIPVHRDNLENYNNAVLDPQNPWDPIEAFKPAIRAAKSRGALCLPQLQFPGRQVPEFLNPNPKSSSDVQLKPCLNKTYGKPTPLTKQEIKELIGRYVWAAEVLKKAGADGIVVSNWIFNNTNIEHQTRPFTDVQSLIAACMPWLPNQPISLTKDQPAN